MNTGIFRKVSIDRLSSPEQLDQLMKITNSKTWITLIGIFLIIIVTLFWSIFGSFPQKVSGQGVLMKSGGIINITHITGGKVNEIKVNVNDIVQKGDIVARINQPELINELNSMILRLNELQSEKDKASTYSISDTSLQLSFLEQETRNSEAIIKSDKNQLQYLEEKIKTLKELEAEGGIAQQTVDEAQAKYEALKQKIVNNENSLKQLQLKKYQTVQGQDKNLTDYDRSVAELKRKISLAEENLNYYSNVISSYTGRVIEISVNEESLINPGVTIMSLEPVGKDLKNLEAVVYVPFHSGKKVKVGMNVQIAPSIVKKEEYGFIYGRVTYVSDYPATLQGMMKVIGNDTLVNTLTQIGPSIEVLVDLIPSSKTESGFKWSSSKGPPIKLQTGTLCAGDIVVGDQPPISMVIPTIKKFFGF